MNKPQILNVEAFNVHPSTAFDGEPIWAVRSTPHEQLYSHVEIGERAARLAIQMAALHPHDLTPARHVSVLATGRYGNAVALTTDPTFRRQDALIAYALVQHAPERG